MTENEVEFLPFHAINEFMRDDFRLKVVRSTLGALVNLPESHRNSLNHLTKKLVTIPGFRHSDKAPTFVRAIPTAKAFGKSAELVAAILAAWAESHATLRTQVYELLVSRGWKTFQAEAMGTSIRSLADVPQLKTEKDWSILPIDADRTRLPGFLAHWPKGETFEALYQAFSEKFPDAQATLDEASLMAVWLALRLPVNIVDEEGKIISDENPDASKNETHEDH
jgi:hypothetical protein